MSETFERSCAHWSEARRREMDHFYALASIDYRHLAEAFDWKSWLESRQADVGDRQLKLLDVACGSGKFPVALSQYADLASSSIKPIDYALLDPSAFSIAEARQALPEPFEAGAEYETTLQSFTCPESAFDVVWATHALYAIPEAELMGGLSRFLTALGGCGFIAHASAAAHYLRFYKFYLQGFKNGEGVPYSSAEQIMATLDRLGVRYDAREIVYENGAADDAVEQIEGYLQRCIFDDTIDLAQMIKNPVTGPFLRSCHQNGRWRFSQRVMMIFICT